MDKYENAVKTKEGKLENFTLKIQGKPFRCDCFCNVFHKPDKQNLYLYKCNRCGSEFDTE